MKRKTLIKRLDDLVRKIVRKRDRDRCCWCGKAVRGRDSQVSHVIRRRLYFARWDLNNVKLLCGHCHALWHDNQLQGASWFKMRYPERHEYLLELRKTKVGTWKDWELLEIEDNLKQIWKEMQ